MAMDEMKKELTEKKEKGATMVEYALMAALIAVICIAAVTFLGRQVSIGFSQIGSQLGN